MAGPPSRSNPQKPGAAASASKDARLAIPADPDEEGPTLVAVDVTEDSATDPPTERGTRGHDSAPVLQKSEEFGPGSVVAGRYRIDRIIGHGGMGAVWQARDLTLDIDV